MTRNGEVRGSADDHRALYADGAPYVDETAADLDTGLRCFCGREVVSTDDTQSGWAHVGEPAMDDKPQ